MPKWLFSSTTKNDPHCLLHQRRSHSPHTHKRRLTCSINKSKEKGLFSFEKCALPISKRARARARLQPRVYIYMGVFTRLPCVCYAVKCAGGALSPLFLCLFLFWLLRPLVFKLLICRDDRSLPGPQ